MAGGWLLRTLAMQAFAVWCRLHPDGLTERSCFPNASFMHLGTLLSTRGYASRRRVLGRSSGRKSDPSALTFTFTNVPNVDFGLGSRFLTRWGYD